MEVHITWMDGQESTYHVTSARVWDSVLVLLMDTRFDPGVPSRINIPVANIRYWSDDAKR